MKFWKILSSLIEQTLPDWRDKFLSYKDLKKKLKLIPHKDSDNFDTQGPTKRPKFPDAADCTDGCGSSSAVPALVMTKEVNDFVRLLEDEIEKFNSFVVEKEEEYVIRWKELQDRVSEANTSNEELMEVGRLIVDFHGEMVLLENYSALNYTGLVKILKKYDKRSGTLLRLPFIQKVLEQPFYSNETLNKLVKECETLLDSLFARKESSVSSEAITTQKSSDTGSSTGKSEKLILVPEDLQDIENMESTYVKLTLSALRVLKEIRSGSSTVSMFSLPPLQSSPSVNVALKEISVAEQVGK